MAGLLYGAGLRLTECLELRVKDVDFGFHQIVVHDGKGSQDRVTVLPNPSRLRFELRSNRSEPGTTPTSPAEADARTSPTPSTESARTRRGAFPGSTPFPTLGRREPRPPASCAATASTTRTSSAPSRALSQGRGFRRQAAAIRSVIVSQRT